MVDSLLSRLWSPQQSLKGAKQLRLTYSVLSTAMRKRRGASTSEIYELRLMIMNRLVFSDLIKTKGHLPSSSHNIWQFSGHASISAIGAFDKANIGIHSHKNSK